MHSAVNASGRKHLDIRLRQKGSVNYTYDQTVSS